MTNDSRQNMIKTAAFLFGERGYAATSFQDVIARSGAPRGSIYHHFPGGKEQLAAEALRWYAERTRTRMAGDTVSGGPTVDAVAGYFAATATWLRKSDFRGGCPIGSVALDLGGDDPLREVVAEAFADWRRVLEHAMRAEGCPEAPEGSGEPLRSPPPCRCRGSSPCRPRPRPSIAAARTPARRHAAPGWRWPARDRPARPRTAARPTPARLAPTPQRVLPARTGRAATQRRARHPAATPRRSRSAMRDRVRPRPTRHGQGLQPRPGAATRQR